MVNMKKRWFVMKKVGEDSRVIRYRKASKYFPTRKTAEAEMKKMRKKHPRTTFKIGGEPKR